MNIIETQNLTKTYGDFTAVSHLNLHVRKGRIYGFLGPNGAGKSTTMKMLLGLTRPTEGSFRIDGKTNPPDRIAILREVGSFLEAPAFYGNLTGEENLEIIRKILGLPKSSVADALELVGLTPFRKRQAKQYSLGMKQRLGLAGALIGQPPILILDEPTAGLDPKERVRFRNLISAFSKDRIVILSTHIVSDVEFVAEDIIMMKAGQVLHFGNPQKIVSEIDGKVWECTVPTDSAEKYAAAYNTSNLRNISGNQTILRIIGDRPPMENVVRVQPTLEDLYLFYFKGGCEE